MIPSNIYAKIIGFYVQILLLSLNSGEWLEKQHPPKKEDGKQHHPKEGRGESSTTPKKEGGQAAQQGRGRRERSTTQVKLRSLILSGGAAFFRLLVGVETVPPKKGRGR